MRKITLILIVLLPLNCFSDDTANQKTQVPQQTNSAAQIQQLQAIIAQQNMEIAALTAEIARLKETVKKQQKVIADNVNIIKFLQLENLSLKSRMPTVQQINQGSQFTDFHPQNNNDKVPAMDSDPKRTIDENKPIKISIEQLYALYAGKQTQFQKEEAYNKYKGKYVIWRDEVYDVNNSSNEDKSGNYYYVEMRHEFKNDIISIILKFPESMGQQLASLKRGSLITYKGKLSDDYPSLRTSLQDNQLYLSEASIIAVKH